MLLTNFHTQNTYLCNEDNMLATELLLQFPDKAHLHLLEGLQLRHWHKDDDGLPAGSNFYLLDTTTHVGGQ